MEEIKLLQEDRDFFEDYRNRFEDKLYRKLANIDALPRIKGNLKQILDTFFDGILHFDDKKVAAKLKNVIWDFHALNIPIRSFLSSIFLDLLRDYADYLERKGTDGFELKKLHLLAGIFDRYLDLVDKLFVEYLDSLEKGKKGEAEIKLDEVRKILETLRKPHTSSIEVLGYYKVFPVLCRSPIYKVGDLFVKLGKCPYKIFIPGERVYLKIPQLGKDAVGEIVNTEGDYMVVRPLRFADIPPARSVRVFPSKETDVRIRVGGRTLYGFLHFITFDEIGIVLPTVEGLKENQKVEIEFTLPTGGVRASGTVKGIERLGNAYLVILDLDCDPHTEQVISRYVLKRQQEILRELKL